MVKLTKGRIKRIKNLCKKYEVEHDLIDYQAMWDASLTEGENFAIIEPFIRSLSRNQEFIKDTAQIKAESEEFEKQVRLAEEEKARIEFEKSVQKIKANNSPNLEKYFSTAKDYIRTLVKSKFTHALILEGDTAIGKSFVTLQTLGELRLKNEIDYVLLNTYATPLELYEFLYHHNGKLIVLDDLMKFFDNELTKGIILSALWHPAGRRIITYLSTTPKLKAPSQFEFTGKLILITNKLPEELSAIKSRCLFYRINFSHEDRIKIIYEICKLNKIHLEIADFIKINSTPAHEVNFRLPFKLYEIYQLNQNNGWQRLAAKQIQANEDFLILQEVLRENATVEKAAIEFMKRSGLSRRTFFYWKRKYESRLNSN